MTVKSKVIFICLRYPMLRMVFKRDRQMIIDGAVVRDPQEYIGFNKTPYGGVFETDDQAKIDYIRNSPQFLQGEIEEVNSTDLAKAKADAPEASGQPVVSGMQGTMPRQPQAAVPAPKPLERVPVGAAKVPSAGDEESSFGE